MICTNCKAAADLRASAAAGHPIYIQTPASPSGLTVGTPDQIDAMVRVGHSGCKGGTWCDCHHAASPLAVTA